MRILTLGGTGFLSSAVVAAARTGGHDVVAVTRGRSGPPPAGVTALTADRDDRQALAAAVASLPGGLPDAVIDVCGYTVAGARAAAEVLGDVAAYAYVSSVSAYSGWPPGPVRGEDEPTWTPDDDVTQYGPMKAQSERVLGEALGDRLLVARAGLIIGPGDRTRRLSSWLHRIATEERVAVPAEDTPMAFVDVRDLAGWLVGAVEQGLSGPVTATGPAGMTSFRGMLEACRAAVRADGGRPAELVPVREEDLLAAGVEPWTDLPFWLPRDVAATAWDVDTSRARAMGLPTRPVEDSVAATWAWMRASDLDHPALPAHVQQVAGGR